MLAGLEIIERSSEHLVANTESLSAPDYKGHARCCEVSLSPPINGAGIHSVRIAELSEAQPCAGQGGDQDLLQRLCFLSHPASIAERGRRNPPLVGRTGVDNYRQKPMMSSQTKTPVGRQSTEAFNHHQLNGDDMPDTITSSCQTLAEVLTEYAPTGDTTGVWKIRTSLSTDKTERYVMLVNTEGPGEGEYKEIGITLGADGFHVAEKWAMELDWEELEKEYRGHSSHWSDDPSIELYDWNNSPGGSYEV